MYRGHSNFFRPAKNHHKRARAIAVIVGKDSTEYARQGILLLSSLQGSSTLQSFRVLVHRHRILLWFDDTTDGSLIADGQDQESLYWQLADEGFLLDEPELFVEFLDTALDIGLLQGDSVQQITFKSITQEQLDRFLPYFPNLTRLSIHDGVVYRCPKCILDMKYLQYLRVPFTYIPKPILHKETLQRIVIPLDNFTVLPNDHNHRKIQSSYSYSVSDYPRLGGHDVFAVEGGNAFPEHVVRSRLNDLH